MKRYFPALAYFYLFVATLIIVGFVNAQLVGENLFSGFAIARAVFLGFVLLSLLYAAFTHILITKDNRLEYREGFFFKKYVVRLEKIRKISVVKVKSPNLINFISTYNLFIHNVGSNQEFDCRLGLVGYRQKSIDNLLDCIAKINPDILKHFER